MSLLKTESVINFKGRAVEGSFNKDLNAIQLHKLLTHRVTDMIEEEILDVLIRELQELKGIVSKKEESNEYFYHYPMFYEVDYGLKKIKMYFPAFDYIHEFSYDHVSELSIKQIAKKQLVSLISERLSHDTSLPHPRFNFLSYSTIYWVGEALYMNVVVPESEVGRNIR